MYLLGEIYTSHRTFSLFNSTRGHDLNIHDLWGHNFCLYHLTKLRIVLYCLFWIYQIILCKADANLRNTSLVHQSTTSSVYGSNTIKAAMTNNSLEIKLLLIFLTLVDGQDRTKAFTRMKQLFINQAHKMQEIMKYIPSRHQKQVQNW